MARRKVETIVTQTAEDIPQIDTFEAPASQGVPFRTQGNIFKHAFHKIKNAFNSLRKTRRGKALLISLVAVIVLIIANDIRLLAQLNSDTHNPISTQILDRNGKLIYEIFTEKRRTPISLNDLPPYVKQATISIEDKDFYKHFGFDLAGIVRAAYSTVFKKKLEGGSTITQQLVKTSLLSPERTIVRKVHEFYLALVIEALYTKDKILELYLNQVPYGGTAYGIEAAAQTYFGKNAKELTLAEAALLAGLPAAPTRFSPFGANPQLARDRQNAVLRRMVEDKYITHEEAEKAKTEELVFKKPEGSAGIHFALWVKEQLVDEYGEKVVEQGGLRVRTTLDLEIQQRAEEIVKTEVDRLAKQKVRNGAAVVTSPGTGEILAMVGSKDYNATDEDGKVNVTLANRQPGSSIKPINYALGLATKKVTPATVFNDISSCFNVVGQELYCPVNYDGSFHGPVQLRFALGNSYNIPAVKMLAINSLEAFVSFAQKMGLTTIIDPKHYGLSLTLGGGEVKMTDMATAFGVFANGGIKQNLVGILEVSDYNGKLLKKTEIHEGDRVLEQDVTFLISHILYDNNARTAAFGPNSFLVVSGHPEVSVKTGTTNDRRDNWTIGYNADVLVATWVGNNDNTPMSGAVSGVSGASPIWNRITKFALDKIEKEDLPHEHRWPLQPDSVKGISICAQTGLSPLATPSADLPAQAGIGENQPEISGNQESCSTRFEYFLEKTDPQEQEVLKRGIGIDKTTGALATGTTPPENVEIQEKSIIFDILGTPFCLDCPFPTESVIFDTENLGINQQ